MSDLYGVSSTFSPSEIYDIADRSGNLAVKALGSRAKPLVVEPSRGRPSLESIVRAPESKLRRVWVNIKPANNPFSKFLVEKGVATPDEKGGVTLTIEQNHATLLSRVTYAEFFSAALHAAGIRKTTVGVDVQL